MVIKVFSFCFIAFSFVAATEDIFKIAVIVDKNIITNKDIEDITQILCLRSNSTVDSKKCVKENKLSAMQLLVNSKIQKSYFDKIEDKLQNIDFDSKDFKFFLTQNEQQFKFNKNIAKEKKIDYALFLEYIKNQFLFLLLVHSYNTNEASKDKQIMEQENMKRAEQLMQKLRSQAFIEFRIDSL